MQIAIFDSTKPDKEYEGSIFYSFTKEALVDEAALPCLVVSCSKLNSYKLERTFTWFLLVCTQKIVVKSEGIVFGYKDEQCNDV